MEAAQSSEAVECGFCFQSDDKMCEPKILPCSHIHCKPCLIIMFEAMKLVRCPLPNCRKVCDQELESLPSASSERHNSWCDHCYKKSGKKQCAIKYCRDKDCNKKLCQDHLERHTAMCEKHEVISLDAYKKEAKRLEKRICKKHNHPIGRARLFSLEICCHECTVQMGLSDHDASVKSLDDMMAVLTTEVRGKTLKLDIELKNLARLHHQTAQSIEEHDNYTKEMTKVLRDTKAEQIREIEDKYKKLEKDLLESRRKSREKLDDFESHTVRDRWFDLQVDKQRIDAHLEYSHQVDIIKEHEKTKAKIELLLRDPPPSLLLPNEAGIKYTGRCRNLELSLEKRDIVISLDHPYKEQTFGREGAHADVPSDENNTDDEFQDALEGPESDTPRKEPDGIQYTEINNKFVPLEALMEEAQPLNVGKRKVKRKHKKQGH